MGLYSFHLQIKMVQPGTRAKRVAYLAEREGLSVDEVARICEVGRSTVYRWLNDEAQPYPKKLRLLAEATGYSWIWLRDGTGEMSNGQEAKSDEVNPDTLGNAGIIFIDADTGKEFFVVEFPPYLRVINPYEVVLRPRRIGSSSDPDVNDLEDESVEEPS